MSDHAKPSFHALPSPRRAPSGCRWLAAAAALALSVAAPHRAHADCGDATGDGKVTSADALFTLKASVGQVDCQLSVCDVDANGRITTTDALRVLRSATGQAATSLGCFVETAVEPDDPLYEDQWGLPAIHADDVWKNRTDCRNVVVAVVDSGVDYFHHDLDDNLWVNFDEIPYNDRDDDGNGLRDDVHGFDFEDNDEYPWDPNGHGTHVAGIIGAEANEIGGVGVCWRARIMALRFLDEFGSGFSSDALQCIDYARKNGASIINNSWGGGAFDSGLYFAFKAASDADILLVNAAGNDGEDLDEWVDYPASFGHPTQVNVAATTEQGDIAAFSNYGATSVHVAAPGDGILSTYHYDDYATLSGTSMASPMVAGMATLLRSQFPSIDAVSLKNILIDSSTPDVDLAGLVLSNGLVNLKSAYNAAADAVLGFSALRSGPPVEEAPPVAVLSRHTVELVAAPGRKYPQLANADEVLANGRTRRVTVAADHVVVTLENDGVVGDLHRAGFAVRRRLVVEQPTYLVDVETTVEETEAALEAIPGVVGAEPDYLLTAR